MFIKLGAQFHWFGLCFFLGLLAGCSHTPGFTPVSENNLSCLAALKQLDALAEKNAGTLQGERIAQVPWLRSNRLLHSYFTEAGTAPQLSALLTRMSKLAYQGLSFEWAAVPPEQQKAWQRRYKIQQPTAIFMRNCIQQAVQVQLKQPENTRKSLRALPHDQDYALLPRILGVYPLSALAFRQGVLREQQHLRQQWNKISATPWYHYMPAVMPQNSPWQPWKADALGLPVIEETTRQNLLRQYSPHWYIANKTDANRPGKPVWRSGELTVDTRQAVSFSHISLARWQNKPILQLNYLLWFAERPPLQTFDWVAGEHDALIFRVSIQMDGRVVAYDSIHLCGCWYRLFLPKERAFDAAKGQSLWQEPVLMERVQTAPKMAVYVSADTHQIVWLEPAPATINGQPTTAQTISYELQPLSSLLSLTENSKVQPVFDQAGYVPGSERFERWFFWPMGVKNPGALRRFGDHAISFIGQRHFDDPFLLEKLGVQ